MTHDSSHKITRLVHTLDLGLGEGLAQALPLPHAVGDHCGMGSEGPAVRVYEPRRVERVRIGKVLGVAVNLKLSIQTDILGHK